MSDISALDIRRAAMDLLARREHSFHELVNKLFRKYTRSKTSAAINGHVDEHMMEETNGSAVRDYLNTEDLQALIVQQVSLLADENLQSDERFVESFVNGRKAKGKGPLRIRQELEQKQLPEGLISRYLDEDDEQWELLAERVYLKKYGESSAKTYQEKAKRFQFMQYRGFSFSLLQSLIK